jgi:uncharacterized FlaG/YvyC family protein
MDTGILLKPVTSAVVNNYAQQTTGAGKNAAFTVLPAEKTATAASDIQASRNGLPLTENQVIIDPQTRDVVFQVIEVSSRQVMRQVPDQALLRIRAYVRAISNNNIEAASKSDLKV